MNSMHPHPPSMSTQLIWVLNYHSLAVKSVHFLDDKWTHHLCVQLQKFPLVPDNQLAWLIIKQGHGVHLGTLVPPSKLLNPTLSLPDAVAPQLLEQHHNAADFGKVGFFIWSQLIRQ